MIYATTLEFVSIGDYFDQWHMVTTSISRKRGLFGTVQLSYKAVYVLMSVCYILPEMMRNMRKIQQFQFAEPIRKKR